MLDRLYNILDTYYYFDMEDYDTTPEEIEKTLLQDPETIINSLMDIIENIQEQTKSPVFLPGYKSFYLFRFQAATDQDRKKILFDGP